MTVNMLCDIQIDFKDLNVIFLPSAILEAFESFHNSFVYWNHSYLNF